MQRIRIAFALLVVGAVGVGSAFAIPAIGARSTAAKTITIKVTASEFKFKLSRTSVPAGTTVIFKVTNKGRIAHDFKINGKKTQLIKPGATKSVKVLFKKKGKYVYICTVPGHVRLGMTGKFGVGTSGGGTVTTTTTTTGGTTTGGGGGPVACSSPTTTVNVEMFEYGYSLSASSVPSGCIQFHILNRPTSGELHNFDLIGVHVGALLSASQTETWAYQLSPGNYGYQCDVGQHASLGMNGTFTVT